MTGKEALYNIELARITEYKKDGIYTKDIRDTTEYRVIKNELEELTKYKRAFEILKKYKLLILKKDEDIDFYEINTLSRAEWVEQEEYELLEELMKGE